MFDAFTTADFVLFASVLFAAAIVHGALGLGFPLIATPLLSIFVDVRTAILITLLPTIVVNVISIVSGREWKASIGKFWSLAIWVLAGGVIGSYLIAINDPAPFKLALALLVFMYLAVDRTEKAVFGFLDRYPKSSMAGFGTLAGLSAGATNTMVPILVIYALEMGLSRATMVPMLNYCFLTGKVSQVGVFGVTGIYGWNFALATLPLAAVAAVALMLGTKIRDRIDADRFRKVVKGVLFILGVTLIIQFWLTG